MSDEGGAEELVEERPELASALESVLAVDEQRDEWTFDDIDIDSGSFGELVSRGVVEKSDNAYQLADPDAVRMALGEKTETSAGDGGFDMSITMPAVNGRDIGLIAAAISVVVFARTYMIREVYRGSDIVLSGNDPYYYRYWVERVATESSGGVDFAALTVLPETLTHGEPLMVATLWWFAELFGGTTATIGHVLAWYPVISAVISGILVYLLAVRVTDDQRVGLATVLFLALIPGHAFRTSLGYADHHAFDYPWLGLTALALLIVMTTVQDSDDLRTVVPWAGGLLLAVGVTGQVLAWEAGPLLIVPVGIAVAAKTILDVKAGRSPLLANTPILAGTGFAAVLVWTLHTSWGWHTELVALTPGLLFAGVIGVVGTATLVTRLGGDIRHLGVSNVVGAILAVLVGQRVFAEQWSEALARTDRLFRSDAIAETYGLFNPGTLGFLLLFGFALVLALPAMVWSVRRAIDDRSDWLVVGVYAWYFLLLATLQVRFVGELATFAALFAGYSFVWLGAKVEVNRPLGNGRIRARVPETRTLASLGLLFLLCGSLGLVQVPVKTSQVTVDEGIHQTAVAIESDAAEQGLEYPANYVLSQWGDNRMYNYFVSGESQSYGYARARYANFTLGTDGEQWYSRLSGRVGYVITENRSAGGSQAMQTRLHDHYGSRSSNAAGLGHYRAVYATDRGSHKAFQLVPGAVIEGSATPNETVTTTTTVMIPNTEFEYTRSTTVPSTGTYSIRVANSGNYTVETANGTQTVRVTEAAVQNGTTVTVDQPV